MQWVSRSSVLLPVVALLLLLAASQELPDPADPPQDAPGAAAPDGKAQRDKLLFAVSVDGQSEMMSPDNIMAEIEKQLESEALRDQELMDLSTNMASQLQMAKRLRFGLNSTSKDVQEAINLFDQIYRISVDSNLREAAAIAALNLGEIHLFLEDKNDFDVNFTKAVEYLLMAEKHGSLRAMHQLSSLYGLGLGVARDEAKSILYDFIASAGGLEDASLSLGYRHLFGKGVPKSCETAAEYYTPVAQSVLNDVVSGNPLPTIEKANLLHESSRHKIDNVDDDVVYFYQQRADGGEANFQAALGQLYFYGGRGVQRNFNRALNYLHQAANNGDPRSMAHLGQMYLDGLGVQANNETALKYFREAAESGSALGYTGLGYMYLNGYGVTKNVQMALKYFTEAANMGWADAQFALGTIYFNGKHVEKSLPTALHYFSLASQQQHPRALYHLGTMYLNGLGTRRSCEVGVELHKMLAERGVWGKVLSKAHQDFMEGEYERALILYIKAAFEGYKVAQINAAWLIENQLGYNGDDFNDLAFALWTMAAEQGDADAERIIGDFYYYQKVNDTAGFAAAAKHYLIAGEKRNAQALFNLGFIYEFGVGVDKDLHLAKRYYDLAIQSHPDAKVPCKIALFVLGWHRFYENLVSLGFWKTVSGSTQEVSGTTAQAADGKSSEQTSWIPSIPSLDDVIYFNDMAFSVEDLLLGSLVLILIVVLYYRYHPQQQPQQQQQ